MIVCQCLCECEMCKFMGVVMVLVCRFVNEFSFRVSGMSVSMSGCILICEFACV